ncbi:HIRAN domain-containing protein [Kitasatospora sp. NPDC004240]
MNAIERGRLGTDHLVVPATQITLPTLKPPGLMSHGHLDVPTRDGQRYRLYFTRRHRSEFETLHKVLLGIVTPTLPTPPSDAVAADSPASPVIPTDRPPRKPAGAAWHLHGAGYFRQQVVGESYHDVELSRLAGPEPAGEKLLVAELHREPRNPHDRDAIQVIIDEGLVGYLPREHAPAYQPELKAVESWGYIAQCPARLWWRREQQDFTARVSLDMAEPGRLVPIVQAPADQLVLPPGRWFQVGKEAEHMDVLVPLLDRAYFPGRAFAHAQLNLVDRPGPRSVISIVVVLIDGGVVGELSRQTSARLKPLLERLRDKRVPCYAEAELTGNTLAAEVRVSLTMPEELLPEFVRRVDAVVEDR